MVNSTFWSNLATSGGGGIMNDNSVLPKAINCIFSGNQAMVGKALACDSQDHLYPSTVQVTTNSIVWENGYWEIYNAGSSTPVVAYCDIQGGWPGATNIEQDPNFVDPGFWDNGNWVNGDYHLTQVSPCIDRGDNTAVPAEIDTDMDGRTRIVDGDCQGGEIVDMGIYEFTYAVFGSFDGDCDIDLDDYAIFADAWMTQEGYPNWNPVCDISQPEDQMINILDLSVFCAHWLLGK